MATLTLHYTAAALTDRGRKRTSNEDAFGYSVEHGVYVVCDGMGGAAAGEVASSLAVDEVLRLFIEHLDASAAEPTGEPTEALPVIAAEAIAVANETIHDKAQRNHRLNGMGTTLVSLILADNHAWVLNIGDSRCYRLRKQHLAQCTLDHSLVEEQVRMGRMTRAEAARSPLRNVITRALGTQSRVTPDVLEFEATSGDVFLLCSDGLTRELSDSQISTILEEHLNSPLEDLCSALVEAANHAGGHDNITCLLVKAE